MKVICRGSLQTGKCPFTRFIRHCTHNKPHEADYGADLPIKCRKEKVAAIWCDCVPITLEYLMREVLEKEENKIDRNNTKKESM